MVLGVLVGDVVCVVIWHPAKVPSKYDARAAFTVAAMSAQSAASSLSLYVPVMGSST